MAKKAKTWLATCTAKYAGKYDYSKSKYVGVSDPIKIRCTEHGLFETTPHRHRQNNGCPGCNLKPRWTAESFISAGKRVHADKFDYSKVKYKNASDKVCIICPSHGPFYQTPMGHVLNGYGCIHCARSLSKRTRRKIVRIGKCKFLVQGYEPFALTWMLENKDLKPEDIKHGASVPYVAYAIKGRQRMHYPDFWIPEQNRLVEVKSVFTFGLPNAMKAKFAECKAKKLAALKLGYKYTLLLFDGSGQRLDLPSNWHSLTRTELLGQLNAE